MPSLTPSRRTVLAAGAGLAILPGAAFAADDKRFEAITGYLDAGYKSLGLPGAGLRVWQNGKVLYDRYFGEYSAETVVPIASCSKWLSAAVLMTLVDEGKISLDAPISTYLPQFTGPKAGLKIRQMFSHSSGLMDPTPEGQWPYTISMAQYADRMAGDLGVIRNAPSAEVRYGSGSMQVVGAAMEKITGKPFNQLFLERIARPCGMSAETTYARQAANTNPLLAGGAFSSQPDYSKFLEMIARKGVAPGGQRVISQASVHEMQRDQTGSAPLKGASSDRMGRLSHYGLGEWIDVEDAQGRTRQVSSPGAFGARPWVNLDRNLYGFFLMRRANNRAPASNDTFDPWKLIDMVHEAADRKT
jgi:CubicO group peptidase (beta-lactamase class C family)